ncbi:MAG: hypothetical protein NT001_01060 [Candidatus Woesearchaeota archaeon]|nr:hypothetical protein [Candidatus Woesearchaeota archaeon]
MAIFIIICPILFAKVIYHERFRTATGAVSWSRYALPNNGDCDASCKVQCDKGNKGESHYHYIIDSGSTSCDCACVTICKQCLICKNPPDEEVRAWIEGMKK